MFDCGLQDMSHLTEQAALLTLTEAARGPWYEVSEVLEETGSAGAVIAGELLPDDDRLRAIARQLVDAAQPEMAVKWTATLAALYQAMPGVSMVSVLDAEYPANLRSVYNRPPFLFVRGSLSGNDRRAVAVVGTRGASPAGVALARDLASKLAAGGVTVVSGMARGIDTAAHAAALDAGGRTVAVMGTGIDRVYPAENAALAERIAGAGAVISQFWPGMPPRPQNFPTRNVVTSGMSIGTVVIEASSTSGAKNQARLALEHGKRLFLVEHLVMKEKWAQDYARRRGAMVVSSIEDVLVALEEETAPVDQLALF